MGITRSEQEGEPEQIHEQSLGDLYRTPTKRLPPELEGRERAGMKRT